MLKFTTPPGEEGNRLMGLIAVILPTLDVPIWFTHVMLAHTQPTLSTESRSVLLSKDLDLAALRSILEDLTQP